MLTGTTTSAARMLHTTQPSISRLIGQIQSASGITLFDMLHGRLRPTAEAHELFDTIQRHFLGLESIEARIDAMRRRSEEHKSALQSLMRISYAVFCLKQKTLSTTYYITQLPQLPD